MNDFYGDSDDSDSFETWRWCEHLSVVEAAMLTVGINPSRYEAAQPNGLREGHFLTIGSSYSFYSATFRPVFRAITEATMNGDLGCEFVHHARTIPTTHAESFFDVPNHSGEGVSIYDTSIETGASVSSNFDMPEQTIDRRYYFLKEPDWQRSSVKVAELREWMRRHGRRPLFFFPDESAGADEFLDPTHERFAPELAYAVKAWKALLPVRKFNGGIKASIEAWIDKNPDAWDGEGPLSNEAKGRISTIVNWNKKGGASKTGG